MAKIDETKSASLVLLEKNRKEVIDALGDDDVMHEGLAKTRKELEELRALEKEEDEKENCLSPTASLTRTNSISGDDIEPEKHVVPSTEPEYNDCDDDAEEKTFSDDGLDESSFASINSSTPSMYHAARTAIDPDRWVGSITCRLEVWRYSRSTGKPHLSSTKDLQPRDPEQGTGEPSRQKLYLHERDFFAEFFPMATKTKGRAFEMDVAELERILWRQKRE